MTSVEAICFDLDGTLCVSSRSDADFHTEVFERAGVEPLFTPRELRATDPAAIGREQADAQGLAGFYTRLYRATARHIETDVDPDAALLDDLGALAGDLHDPTAVQFRDGAEELLSYVGDEYAVGLITNGRRETQTRKLEALGIAEVFDATVFCDPDRGIDAKPAREPFELALDGLRTRPGATLHVGDSHAEDVCGAHRAGLRSVWVPPDRPHEDPPADPEPAPTYRVSSLEELNDLL